MDGKCLITVQPMLEMAGRREGAEMQVEGEVSVALWGPAHAQRAAEAGCCVIVQIKRQRGGVWLVMETVLGGQALLGLQMSGAGSTYHRPTQNVKNAAGTKG